MPCRGFVDPCLFPGETAIEIGERMACLAEHFPPKGRDVSRCVGAEREPAVAADDVSRAGDVHCVRHHGGGDVVQRVDHVHGFEERGQDGRDGVVAGHVLTETPGAQRGTGILPVAGCGQDARATTVARFGRRHKQTHGARLFFGEATKSFHGVVPPGHEHRVEPRAKDSFQGPGIPVFDLDPFPEQAEDTAAVDVERVGLRQQETGGFGHRSLFLVRMVEDLEAGRGGRSKGAEFGQARLGFAQGVRAFPEQGFGRGGGLGGLGDSLFTAAEVFRHLRFSFGEIGRHPGELPFLRGQPFPSQDGRARFRLHADELVLQLGREAFHLHGFDAEILDFPAHRFRALAAVFKLAVACVERFLGFGMLRARAFHVLHDTLDFCALVLELPVGLFHFAGGPFRPAAVFLDALPIRFDQLARAVQPALRVHRGFQPGADLVLGLHQGLSQDAVSLFELVDLLVGFLQSARHSRDVLFERAHVVVHGCDATHGAVDVQGAQFLVERLVAAGLAGLSLDRADLALHFADDVGKPQKVGLGVFQFPDRLFPVALELGDPAGLFEDGAPVLRAGAEDLVDAALFHDRVGGRADAGIHEKALDILETAGGLVHEILALAGAEHAAGDGHLVILGTQRVFAVGEGNADFGHAQGLAGVGAVEDAVFHPVAAQGLGALFAEDPADRVRDIALPAAVGSDHTGHSGLEMERGPVGETLEAGHIQGLQVHRFLPLSPIAVRFWTSISCVFGPDNHNM